MDGDEIWTGSKRQRDALRARFGGRCCYCGEMLTKMHADHLDPVIRITRDPWGRPLPTSEHRMVRENKNTVANMMPSCGPCNISKGGYRLEDWREIISRSAEIVAREKSIFRAGVRFGIIQVVRRPVVFYFEEFSDIRPAAPSLASGDDASLAVDDLDKRP